MRLETVIVTKIADLQMFHSVSFRSSWPHHSQFGQFWGLAENLLTARRRTSTSKCLLWCGDACCWLEWTCSRRRCMSRALCLYATWCGLGRCRLLQTVDHRFYKSAFSCCELSFCWSHATLWSSHESELHMKSVLCYSEWYATRLKTTCPEASW